MNKVKDEVLLNLYISKQSTIAELLDEAKKQVSVELESCGAENSTELTSCGMEGYIKINKEELSAHSLFSSRWK